MEQSLEAAGLVREAPGGEDALAGPETPGEEAGQKKLQEAAGLRQGSWGCTEPAGLSCPACRPRADETALCLTGRFGVSLGQPHSPPNPHHCEPHVVMGACAQHPPSARRGFESSGIGTMGLPATAHLIPGESSGDGL